MAFTVCHCRFLEFATSVVADFTDTAPDQRRHFLGNTVACGFYYLWCHHASCLLLCMMSSCELSIIMYSWRHHASCLLLCMMSSCELSIIMYDVIMQAAYYYVWRHHASCLLLCMTSSCELSIIMYDVIMRAAYYYVWCHHASCLLFANYSQFPSLLIIILE